jgi:sRNA-binding protein
MFNLKDRKPLKIGIFHELYALLKDRYSKAQLHKALGYYTYNAGYQRALVTQDGQIGGEVTEEHKARAHAQLMKIKKGSPGKNNL